MILLRPKISAISANPLVIFSVSPLIRIRNQIVGVRLGGTAVLECEIEAFPEPVTYWERGDGRLLEKSDKYRIDLIEKKDGYKVICVRFFLSINTRIQYH